MGFVLCQTLLIPLPFGSEIVVEFEIGSLSGVHERRVKPGINGLYGVVGDPPVNLLMVLNLIHPLNIHEPPASFVDSMELKVFLDLGSCSFHARNQAQQYNYCYFMSNNFIILSCLSPGIIYQLECWVFYIQPFFNIMACFVGTSYHQVLQVPYALKEPVDCFGEKDKKPVVSMYYDDDAGQFIILADSNSATIARFGQEEEQLRNYPLAEAYQDSTVKIIANYMLNGTLLYFATNTGKVIMQDLASDNNNQPSMIEAQLQKVDSKHFYKRAILNSNCETAFVGKGVLPFIYSHENAVLMWKGKNVPNDHLDLEVPIDDIDCAFMNNCNQLAVANANDMIRIFDIRNRAKKPVLDHHLKLNDNNKSRISKLEVNEDFDHYFYVGKENGSIYELDARKACQPTRKFKGITTTIKDMKVTNSSIHVVSLDSFFRTFNREDRTLTSERYLNAHPTCLVVPRKEEANSEIYQVEELESEEEVEVKKQMPVKVKQIRKRNKVGLRYLEVDPNWAEIKLEEEARMKLEMGAQDEVKHEAKQDCSDENWDL